VTGAEPTTLADALETLRRRQADLDASRRQVADLNRELDEMNRGFIAVHGELEDARQAEARLAAIVQSSDDAMFSMTPDGIVETWNPGAARLLGYPAARVVGRPVETLMPDELRDEFGVAVERIRSGGRVAPYDARWRREDGGLVDVAVTLSALRDPLGAYVGFSVVLRDITHRLRADAALATARAAAEVMADRDRIARDLHDMVIQRIFGAGMALQGIAGLVTLPKAVTRIESVIGELDITIRELRMAIFELHRDPQDATSLRARVLDLVSTAADALGFSPTVSFDGPIDAAVPDDVAIHLLAVAQEALSNVARHAHASRAELTLSAGSEIVLRISDNGRGFGQVTRSSGLRNMRERAAALGGTFDAVSRPHPETTLDAGTTGDSGSPDSDVSESGTRIEWRIPLA
jgi:PAS domain S-box-containing protein